MYWYMTTGSDYPENRRLVLKIVKEGYTLHALTVEADKDAMEYYKMRFLGYGSFDDAEIQESIKRATH